MASGDSGESESGSSSALVPAFIPHVSYCPYPYPEIQSSSKYMAKGGRAKWKIDFSVPEKLSYQVQEPCSRTSFFQTFKPERVKDMIDSIKKSSDQWYQRCGQGQHESNESEEEVEERRQKVPHYLDVITDLNMTEATEPFYSFGIKLTGVTDLYTIATKEGLVEFDDENYRKNFFDAFELTSREKDMSIIIDKLHRHRDKHILASMSNTINIVLSSSHHKFHKTEEALVQEFRKVQEQYKSSEAVQLFLGLILRYSKLVREDFKCLVEHFKEEHLRDFVSRLLNVSFLTHAGPSLWPPFQITQKLRCTPDLTCTPQYTVDEIPVMLDYSQAMEDVTIEIKSINQSNDVYHTKEGSSWLDSAPDPITDLCEKMKELGSKKTLWSFPLLWQLFEQLLGNLMLAGSQSFVQPKRPGTIFQSCLLVANNMVYVCVLTMDIRTFMEIKDLKMAADTLDVILNLAKRNTPFCKLYITTVPKQIGNAASLARGCLKYFCCAHFTPSP